MVFFCCCCCCCCCCWFPSKLRKKQGVPTTATTAATYPGPGVQRAAFQQEGFVPQAEELHLLVHQRNPRPNLAVEGTPQRVVPCWGGGGGLPFLGDPPTQRNKRRGKNKQKTSKNGGFSWCSFKATKSILTKKETRDHFRRTPILTQATFGHGKHENRPASCQCGLLWSQSELFDTKWSFQKVSLQAG